MAHVPHHPDCIPHIPFEEYKERYPRLFKLDRTEDGILTAKWHHQDQSCMWGNVLHRAINQLMTDIGQDYETEIVILGGSGKNYVAQSSELDIDHEVRKQNWFLFEQNWTDGCRNCETIVNLEVPTIGVINGPGYHTEMALMCDITLIADDANIVDPHFYCGFVPGDGIQIAFRESMGIKRANYAMLTGQIITPQQALEYGMVNEIVPKAKIYDRAMEIAKEIMKKDRITRRLTTGVLRNPWKEALAHELRTGFCAEMFNSKSAYASHANGGWREITERCGAEWTEQDKSYHLGPNPDGSGKHELEEDDHQASGQFNG